MISLLCIFIFFVQLNVVCNAHAQENFLRANNLYEEKEYQQAYELYNLIENKGWAVWYNMGNCCYKLGKFIQAFSCWHHAMQGAHGKEYDSILLNIAAVELKLNIEKKEAGWNRFLNGVKKSLKNITLFVVQILFLLSWCLLFFFIKKYNRGKKYRILFLGIILFLNVVLMLALIVKYYDLQCKGIVMKESVALFAGPNEQYHMLGLVPLASLVKVQETKEQWCKIKSDYGCGWVLSDSITVI